MLILYQDLIENKDRFAEKLITWFHSEGRTLPWRDTDNPYYILVAEIMLQQTQVKTVIPYYLRFIETLPTIGDLAYADEEKLHFLWQGLGYYSRVRRLQQLAYIVVTKYGGLIPNEKELLMKLPGIGPYTCGAVLSFCFHKVEPAIDGNVKRVLSRVFLEEDDISKMATLKRLEEKLIKILPDNIYPFNQGLIELGALYCTPTKPKCIDCPINAFCLGYKKGKVSLVPKKVKKENTPVIHVPILIIEAENEFLFVKREMKGLLASMWGLPIIQQDYPTGESQISDMRRSITDYLDDVLNIGEKTLTSEDVISYIGKCKHIFSSIIWEQSIFVLSGKNLRNRIQLIEDPKLKWAKENEVSLPTAFRKSIKVFHESK